MELHIDDFNNPHSPYPSENKRMETPKNVRFEETSRNNYNVKQITPNVQQIIPNVQPTRQTISYDDILAKMGMYVDNGKLHLLTTNKKDNHISPPQKINNIQPPPSILKSEMKNSYIYNKYFKHELKEPPTIKIPKTKEEYKQMLIAKIIEREHIKRIKSKKLIMNTNNIHMYAQNNQIKDLNRLFQFSQR